MNSALTKKMMDKHDQRQQEFDYIPKESFAVAYMLGFRDGTLAVGEMFLKEPAKEPTPCQHSFWFRCKCGQGICMYCGGHYDDRGNRG